MQPTNQEKTASIAQPYHDTFTTTVEALVQDCSELVKEREKLNYRRQQLLEEHRALLLHLESCTKKLYDLQEQVGNTIENLHHWKSQHMTVHASSSLPSTSQADPGI
jgi:hypothetical protein